ncbi:MAG: UDP-N-acetylmuramate dehydrogenase [Pseudomonadota bacterium]|nr:UDP-N-acetylmuramate dehydrogenase [Pseudomonadota bacterium]
MNAAASVRDSSSAVRGRVLRDEPMSRHTSWRVGGPADCFFEPADREDLIAFVRALPQAEPVLWLGLGSNMLVRDGGWRGTVISLHGALDALRLEDGTPHAIAAEAGVHCARLSKFAERGNWAGLGFMAGIPGTVGGALAMNAGAWGGVTWDQVIDAELIFRDGHVERVSNAQIRYGYRHVELPEAALGFLGARFTVTPDTDGEYARLTRESLARRKATQPVGKPSAGSTFRNPPGDHAARLIESCGLKGHRIGGAEVSTMHANFLIAEAGARAADVEALVEHVRTTVRSKTGVDLQPEVRIVGVAQ